MDVGERLAEALGAVGVDALFGVPGGQTMPLYRSTRARGISHVVMRDERNAACAADAAARVSGQIGVCDATVGPGVTNLVSGLAEAYAASVPVLAIVADVRTDQGHLRRRSVVSQALDQSALLAPVTKWVGRVQRAEALDDVLAQALRVATSGRPGPVALEVPEDVWMQETSPRRPFELDDGRAPRARPRPAAGAIADAVALLAGAQRPIVLAGGGAVASGASDEVAALSREQGIPVVTTVNGKGIVDELEPTALGVVGLFGAERAIAAIDAADVAIVVGSKLDQFSTHGWRLPRPEAQVVHIDVDGEEVGRVRRADVGIVADAREALRELRAAVASDTPPSRTPWWRPLTDGTKQPRSVPDLAEDGRLHPARVVQVVEGVLGPTDVVVSDASYASGWAATNLRMRGPRRFVAPRGLAGVGWSPGAAIGASVASEPGGRVVVVTGDGGWAYGMAEVETAVRLRADITVVVLNNAALAWIVHGEEHMQIEPTSTFGDADFAAAGRALGAHGSRARSLEELSDELERVMGVPGPSVIDVATSLDASPIVSLRGVRATAAAGRSEQGPAEKKGIDT